MGWDEWYNDPGGLPASSSLDFGSRSAFNTEEYGGGLQQYAPSRGIFGDIASNLGRGSVELVGLTGNMLDQFGLTTGLEEWAEAAPSRYEFLRPDFEEFLGEESWFKRSAMGALQSAPSSLAPIAAAGGAMLLAPAVGVGAAAIGTGVGIASLVGLFGVGTYNQTYREHKDTIGESSARQLALETAAWEVGTEGISDAVAVLTGGMLGAPVKGLTQGLKGSVKSTLGSIMQMGAPRFLRSVGATASAEVGSESLNSFMQTRAQIRHRVEGYEGLDPTAAALASIGPALFLSGGISLTTQTLGKARRNQVVNILKEPDPETSLEIAGSKPRKL